MLPLATGPTTPPPFDPLAANQPLHLRVAGHVKLALWPAQEADKAAVKERVVAGPQAGSHQQQQGGEGRQAGWPATGDVRAGPRRFVGR